MINVELSVVFSFRNEEDNLPELINRLEISLKDINYELIFVNDDSTDSSLDILLDKRNNNKRIKILDLSRRFGLAQGVIAGLKQSLGDYVVYLDADLQDPPELVLDIYMNAIQNSIDVIHTRRTSRLGESWFKLFLTSIAYKVIRYFSTLELVENCGDFKLLSRRTVDAILTSNEKDPYMRGISVWAGFTQSYYDYVRCERFKGKSKFNVFSLNPIEEFFRGITSYSVTPLYWVSALASIFIGLILLLLVYIVINKIIGNPTSGWSLLMFYISVCFGMILFINSIIAIYLARIYKQVINRPEYIIKKKYE